MNKVMITFVSILKKDIKNYYLKPPNISWGMIFPLAWALMFVLRSETAVEIRDILPGIIALSILFGTTSMLAVTITFEKKQKSFERLLLAPISLHTLMLAKTLGAITFGVLNALVPILLATTLTDLAGTNWLLLFTSIILIAVTSTFLGLLIAVAAKEVFEAQTFSNFFRFPMIFLCGLFIPVRELPLLLQPLSYVLPLTYGVDIIKAATYAGGHLPVFLSLLILIGFAVAMFTVSIYRIQAKWVQ